MEKEKFENLPVESPAHVPMEMAQSLFFNVAKFELAQRVAKVFAGSDMVPKQFQGNVGNCVIALNLAERMGTDPFMLMQNIYIVHGKPGIEAKLAIALVNSTGKFSPLQYQYNEKKTECFAHAKRTGSGELCKGVTVSLSMAQAEGWTSKQGSKWKTMPELMLMYRAAMFFARAYCPEALLGMQTREELQDVGTMDLERESNGTYSAPEATEDLESRILNGGQHADQMSPADVDMGKTNDQPLDWDPVTAPIQKQYRGPKRQAIMTELESRGIEYNPGWSGLLLHQTLKDDIPGDDDPGDEYEKKLDGANLTFKNQQKNSPDIWAAACQNAKIANPEMGLADLDEADRFDACFMEIINNG